LDFWTAITIVGGVAAGIAGLPLVWYTRKQANAESPSPLNLRLRTIDTTIATLQTTFIAHETKDMEKFNDLDLRLVELSTSVKVNMEYIKQALDEIRAGQRKER
jgi:hypothetical protein